MVPQNLLLKREILWFFFFRKEGGYNARIKRTDQENEKVTKKTDQVGLKSDPVEKKSDQESVKSDLVEAKSDPVEKELCKSKL